MYAQRAATPKPVTSGGKLWVEASTLACRLFLRHRPVVRKVRWLLPALSAGGRCITLKPGLHTETNIQVIKQFLDCTISVNEQHEDLSLYSGSGINSSSPSTVPKRPSDQSDLACSIRSFEVDTKFHQICRGPSDEPPITMMRLSESA